jgi:prepilin-type processing-associated H-X9-DG protein
MTLPYIGRMDLYKTIGPSIPASYVSTFVCPAFPPNAALTSPLTYGGNVGRDAGNAARASGVMLDTTITTSGAMNGRISMQDIVDGTATTLLLSEKSGRIYVNGSPPAILADWTDPVVGGDQGKRPGGDSRNGVFGHPNGARSDNRVINRPEGAWGESFVDNLFPSSNHGGGVVAAFCDGSTVFLRDSLQPWVYAQLLSSNHAASNSDWNQITTGTALTVTGTYHTLREADYK